MTHYPAKLLLFGEYILLLGAPALAVPVPAFGGDWNWGTKGKPIPWAWLDSPGMKNAGLELEDLRSDLSRGLHFDSNIPIGYGLGSSGALCAAIYDHYCMRKTSDLAALKAIFAGMESFFHGQSSGIDPLTSYLKRPLYIANKTEVSYFEGSDWLQNKPVIFLLDARMPRKTGPLVQWFLEQSETAAFKDQLEARLLPAHEAMIKAWSAADATAFWEALRRVSLFQFEEMPPMIPDTLRRLWADSLNRSDVVLKICGAGGGGFTLGFATSKQAAVELAGKHPVVFPFETSAHNAEKEA